jgi:hypothetical protein
MGETLVNTELQACARRSSICTISQVTICLQSTESVHDSNGWF